LVVGFINSFEKREQGKKWTPGLFTFLENQCLQDQQKGRHLAGLFTFWKTKIGPGDSYKRHGCVRASLPCLSVPPHGWPHAATGRIVPKADSVSSSV